MDDRKLDAALGAWGKADLAGGAGETAALARILGHADAIATATGPDVARPNARRWWAGGMVAVAASAAIALLLAPNGTPGSGTADGAGDGSVMLADASGDEAAAFALLYTPTSEEEYQL